MPQETDQTAHIILDKELRRDIDAIIQRLRAAEADDLAILTRDEADAVNQLPAVRGRRSRERALAITKLQEAVMWLGMDLKAINEENPGAVENPYPSSKDPSTTKIEPTADGLKM